MTADQRERIMPLAFAITRPATGGPSAYLGLVMATDARDPRSTKAWKRLRAQVYTEETHCWRCGRWVNQQLPKTHAMSRSADHLDPLARGGAAIPARARVRLAHRGHRPDKQPRTLTIAIEMI